MEEKRYSIEGITPLRGEVELSGAKNAALPCICATLLTDQEVVLRNVPDIADVQALLEIFDYLGVQRSYADRVLRVRAAKIECRTIPHELVGKFRASILLLGPLLARCGEVQIAYPGGCVLGKRPVDAHIDALVQLGVEDCSTEESLHLRGKLHDGVVVLPEFSVTATENVLLAAAAIPGTTTRLHIAAAEPHVQDLCNLLQQMGAQLAGGGTHDVIVGGSQLHGADFSITTDYLEAGFFALAGVLTGGDVRILGAREEQLLSFLKAMTRINANWHFEEEGVLHVRSSGHLTSCSIRTNIFPGFPTDLQAAFGVAMTQAHGVSRIFERLFEGRLAYLYELEKMGAHIEILNSHEALLIGPTPLRGRTVTSNDIRAGAAMVLAGLCARGTTLITDVQYIERGYDRLIEKLQELGASIERITTDPLHSAHADSPISRRPDRIVHNRPGIPAGVSS